LDFNGIDNPFKNSSFDVDHAKSGSQAHGASSKKKTISMAAICELSSSEGNTRKCLFHVPERTHSRFMEIEIGGKGIREKLQCSDEERGVVTQVHI
jgi:hypothetical protein